MFKLTLKTSLYGLMLLGTLTAASMSAAAPAPSHAVSVQVVNLCNIPIVTHIDNNWGSQYTGDYNIPAAGSKDEQGNKNDRIGFIFSSNNDEEFYTISYQGATCKVDYPMIRDYWMLDAFISGCNKTPKCSFRPSTTMKASKN